MDKISYALGMLIAQNLKEMKVEGLDTARFAQAVTAVLSGEKAEMPLAEAQATVQKFLQEREAEAGRAAREAGEAFLAENAKKEGITVLESGLQYEVLTAAIGQKPTAADTVRCHYEGRLIDGTVFDSSYRRGETTGIGEIVIEGDAGISGSANADDRIYNLQGQQVTAPVKGLYIKNNKKVVIK